MQAKIAGAWTSFMFLVKYVDYFHLYKPGFVVDLLAGTVFEFNIGPTFMSFCAHADSDPVDDGDALRGATRRVNRTTNLVVAAIYIPVSVSLSADVGLLMPSSAPSGLEVLLLGFILRCAWTWLRNVANPAFPTPTRRPPTSPQVGIAARRVGLVRHIEAVGILVDELLILRKAHQERLHVRAYGTDLDALGRGVVEYRLHQQPREPMPLILVGGDGVQKDQRPVVEAPIAFETDEFLT